MHTPSEDQIHKAIAASGFLFEHEAATSLEALGFHVDTSWAFSDPEQSDKSRELDIRAFKRAYSDESAGCQVFVELLVECKDFDAPLVFLERPKNSPELLQAVPKQYLFPHPRYRVRLDSNRFREVPAFQHLDLTRLHYYYSNPVKATQFVKISRKGSDWVANHDGVHDAILLPLAKAFEARRKSVQDILKGKNMVTVWLFFPVVLLRNQLLALNPSSPDRKLESRERISYVRKLDSDSLSGSYHLDFVVLRGLDSYVNSEVMTFAKGIADICQGSPALFHSNAA